MTDAHRSAWLRSGVVFSLGCFAALARLAVRGWLSRDPRSATSAAAATVGLVVLCLIVAAGLKLLVWGVTRKPVTWAGWLGPSTALAWSLALLPLPTSDFWANGGTDDTLVLYPLLVVPAAVLWFVLEHGGPPERYAWLRLSAQTGLLTAALLLGVAALVEGVEADARRARALMLAGPLLVSSLVGGALTTRVTAKRAATP